MLTVLSIFYVILKLLKVLNSVSVKTTRDDKTRNDYVYKRLKMISLIDSVQKPPLHIQNKEIKCNPLGPSKLRKKNNLVGNRPQIVDIKQEFQIWSQNMKDYDRLRKSLINIA
jgi:hypothetical protein